MNKKLINKNKKIRENRPKIPSDILYSTYENNGVFQICFKSRGCVNYLAGFCIMCDYGVGTNITSEELEIAFDNALKESHEKIRILLLNSYGSILDYNEISENCLNALLKKIKETDIKNVIFETHYKTITIEKLQLIKRMLHDKNVSFEFGLETSDEKIREDYLLKCIDNNRFIATVNLIHSFDMKVSANIIVGIPFLTRDDQVKNAIESVDWCFKHGIDEVDLFPMNIRPYTLLEELYRRKEYDIISHWLLIEVLESIPYRYLKDIYIAWYGNRDLKYDDKVHSIFPTSCPKCEKKLDNFYEEYLKNKDSKCRKKLIQDLIAHKNCNCYFKNEIDDNAK